MGFIVTNSTNKHNFNKSFKLGQEGEKTIVAEHSDELTLQDATGRNGDDAYRLENGKNTSEKVEIKREDYKYSKFFNKEKKESPNAAIECWSKLEEKKVGGPWQAKDNSAKYYIHYFLKNNGMALVFKTDDFCLELESYIKKNSKKPLSVPNECWSKNGVKNSWMTQVYAIKVKDLLKFESLITLAYKGESLFSRNQLNIDSFN